MELNKHAIGFLSELERVQVPQVKVLYLYFTNMDLYLYFYFEKITWYLYLHFEQILLYFYLSTKTGTFHFVLKKYIKYIMQIMLTSYEKCLNTTKMSSDQK
jgi:hypothetical protein